MSTPLASALLSDVWAMEPRALEQFLAEVSALPPETEVLAAGMRPRAPEADPGPPFQVRDGVAHIGVQGPLLKSIPWILEALGVRATSYEKLGSALRAAVADPNVRAINLNVDSPGGQVSGLAEAAAVVLGAGQFKPVLAHVNGQGASAAYWLSSQASTLTASEGSLLGSIGLLMSLRDTSAAAEQAGVKVHVIASSPLKGTGVEGAPVTDEQLADLKRLIDQQAAMFVDAVASGRGMTPAQVTPSATGQVWFAEDAKARGLIDAVATAEEAHRLAASSAPLHLQQPLTAPLSGAKQESPMADPATTVAAAAPGQDSAVKELLEKVAQLEAENQKSQAQVAAMTQAVKDQAVAAAVASGSVTPAMKASVEKFASLASPDELKEFLAGLPQATHPARVSNAGGKPEDAGPVVTDEDRAVAKLFNLKAEDVATKGNWAAIDVWGRQITSDGTVVEEN